jgi:AAA family ATP:ADP antiporter
MSHAPLGRRLFGGLCTLAFTTMLSYAVAGSAAHALFLTRYGAERLPWVWLLVAAASAVAVGCVNIASRRYNVVQLFVRASMVSAAGLLVLLVLQQRQVSWVPFALYVWKDIYIIVLVELFWTFANLAFGMRTATRTYGLFCAAGSMGGIAGSQAMAYLSPRMGTLPVLWLLVPLLAGGAWGCAALAHHVPVPAPKGKTAHGRAPLRAGWDLVRTSPYLLLMMALVAVVQVTLNLNEFAFSAAVQTEFTDLDTRTQAIAHVSVIINALSFALQVCTAPLVRAVGMPATMISLPVVLGGSLFMALAQPGFATLALCQIVGKSTDYSLFRACKEMLYIPLSYAEKTQGKAVVDIFVYRFAKGGVGLFLLAVAGMGAHVAVRVVTLLLCVAWLFLVTLLLRRWHRVRPR